MGGATWLRERRDAVRADYDADGPPLRQPPLPRPRRTARSSIASSQRSRLEVIAEATDDEGDYGYWHLLVRTPVS
jgi:hypothetical protein